MRSARPLASEPLGQRLATGAVVCELDLHADRLHYALLAGSGPADGWVSVRLRGVPLLRRLAPDEVLSRGVGAKAAVRQPDLDLGSASSTGSGTASEPSPRSCGELSGRAAPDHGLWPEDWLSRLVLGPRPRPGGPSERWPGAARPTFRSICVFGAHHSCTGAVMRELPRFFQASVVNKHFDPLLWKHSVFAEPPRLPDDAFCVCLVKDPVFWIQSLGRDPAGGTFYEITPVEVADDGCGGDLFCESMSRERQQLFGPIYFDGLIYDNALALWEATVRNYFDEEFFPAWRTAVIRCEDFLFNFEGVMQELHARGLDLRPAPVERHGGAEARCLGAASAGSLPAGFGLGPLPEAAPQAQEPVAWQPLDATAKDETHPPCTRRRRQELLTYYRSAANRFQGLGNFECDCLRQMAPDLLGFLRYGHEAPGSWLSGDVAC